MCLTFLYTRYRSEVLFSIYQIFYLSTRVLILAATSLGRDSDGCSFETATGIGPS
jgi:hypothetical protein